MPVEDENIVPELVGRTIGQYQLLELIAAGDTFSVYKAFQPAMGRYVALKLLSPALASAPEYVEQFRRRVSRIASLQHRHILPIYDYGKEEAVPYFVARYVEDGTVLDHLPDYFSPKAAWRMLQPVADALDHAHAHGLVHANLKPENILLDEEHLPLLADFAGLAHEPLLRPVSGPYASPEQVEGTAVDRRSDVYGLGALLYTLLIGEPPPLGRVPTPRTWRPDLSPAMEKVILTAMASAPSRRYQSAGEFARALERALQAPSLAAQPEPAAESAPVPVDSKARRKRRDSSSMSGLIYLLGTLALLAALAAIYWLIFGTRDSSDPVPTAAPGVPVVTVIRAASVRAGPDEDYELLATLAQGESAEVVGVSPDGNWWVIRFPAAADGRGWVAESDTNVHDSGNLPVVQPPPLPGSSP